MKHCAAKRRNNRRSFSAVFFSFATKSKVERINPNCQRKDRLPAVFFALVAGMGPINDRSNDA
jgi:hypothetical protein